MADVDQVPEPQVAGSVDGRVARRQRNIDAVVDVVLEMFAEDAMFPTIEQAATRSGLSLRSVYRYFADPGELLEAAIRRSDERGAELGRIDAIGQGSLDDRIAGFVEARLRLHRGVGPVFRATVANASRLPRIQDELAKNRLNMRKQFELQFAQELAGRNANERAAILSAGDLLTQLESIDFLRRHRELSVAKTRATLVAGLGRLLRP